MLRKRSASSNFFPLNFFSLGTAALCTILAAMLLMFSIDPAQAATTVDSLGNASPGFSDGDTPGILQLIDAQSGQPAPFDAAEGNDLIGPDFSASWTHSYSAITDTITAASVTIALAAHDSASPGSQVASFAVNGTDLTSLLNTELDGRGGAVNEYNVYTLVLPPATFSSLADGTANWTLDLQGPTSSGPFNGAHIIFSTLTVESASSSTPPVADAGPDQGVPVGATVNLDGSGSSDADGDTLTFAWTLTSVPADSTASLTGATTASPSFVADLAGDYAVELVVNDGTDDSAPDTVIITASEGVTTLLSDDFNRDDSVLVGEDWVEVEETETSIAIASQKLVFDDTDGVANRPLARRTFSPVSTGTLQWDLDFDWARTGDEDSYRLMMQLGDGAEMSDDSQNAGVGVNLIWSRIFGAHQSLGYSQADLDTRLELLSGPAAISVVADLDALTFSVAVGGQIVGSDIPFDNDVSIDTVRLVADNIDPTNFSGRSVDNVIIIAPAIQRHTLNVVGAGPGDGAVTDTRIDCTINAGTTDGTCADTVNTGSSVVLTATADPGSVFGGWTDCDTPAGDQCTMTVDADKTVTATFGRINSPPVADAGPDLLVQVGATVNLDGSGSSDVDDDPLTFAWTLTSVPADSTASLTGATTASPSFVADLAGDYVVELVVNDGTDDSTPDTVNVAASEGPATLLSDDFDRDDSPVVGEDWVEVEETETSIAIDSQKLVFDDNDGVANRPLARRTFSPVSTGTLQWDLDFDWARTGDEDSYRLMMQLGDGALMSDDSQNAGVAVNLIWSRIFGAHQSLGYSQEGVDTGLTVLSGPAAISVVADLDARTYLVAVDGSTVGSDIPFDADVAIDTVRLVADDIDQTNFSGRSIDNLVIITPAIQRHTLNVLGAGPGNGSVTDTRINCTINAGTTDGTCADTVNSGSNIVLTAEADTGSVFGGWTDCDTPEGDQCTMTVDADKTVTATFSFEPLQAEPSFSLFQDPSDGATGFKVDVTRVFDPGTGDDVPVSLGSFQAQLTYPDPASNPSFPPGSRCVNILEVREMDFPITGRTIDDSAGVATLDGTQAGGVAAPANFGHALTQLTGSANQQCQVHSELTTLSDVDSNPIAVSTVLTETVQRGDARADGDVTIADALYIAQYLMESRPVCTTSEDTTCLHSVNSASVQHDGELDQKTIGDARFIAEYLLGLRDEFYNPVP